MVRQSGGNLEEAKDIFHEAMLLYLEKSETRGSAIEDPNAYLYVISRNLWLKFQRNKVDITDLVTQTEDQSSQLISDQKLLSLIKESGEKCLRLLKAFYYDKLSYHTIASVFGFNGTRSATVQKFKCIEKLKSVIKQNKLSYEDFLE